QQNFSGLSCDSTRYGNANALTLQPISPGAPDWRDPLCTKRSPDSPTRAGFARFVTGPRTSADFKHNFRTEYQKDPFVCLSIWLTPPGHSGLNCSFATASCRPYTSFATSGAVSSGCNFTKRPACT